LLVHGKHTFQYDSPVPNSVRSGSELRHYQRIALQVSPGKYDFFVVFGDADPESYYGYTKGHSSYVEFSARISEHCRVMHAGSLEVGYAAGSKLSHNGAAELPGGANIEVLEDGTGRTPAVTHIVRDSRPPVFHVTHWKAGSQWIYRILLRCVPERIIQPRIGEVQVRYDPIRRGGVYPTVYMTKEELIRVAPTDSQRFVVIRDLRDTLVSTYFSFKYSHPLLHGGLVELRKKLDVLDKESALLYLLDEFPVSSSAKIQLSWVEAREPILKYEELLEHDLELLERTLIDKCGIPIDPEELRKAVLDNRFESFTNGRKRGSEDIFAHERKGIVGDWRNHFTERIKAAFKARYGGVLVATGYENDLRW